MPVFVGSPLLNTQELPGQKPCRRLLCWNQGQESGGGGVGQGSNNWSPGSCPGVRHLAVAIRSIRHFRTAEVASGLSHQARL